MQNKTWLDLRRRLAALPMVGFKTVKWVDPSVENRFRSASASKVGGKPGEKSSDKIAAPC